MSNETSNQPDPNDPFDLYRQLNVTQLKIELNGRGVETTGKWCAGTNRCHASRNGER